MGREAAGHVRHSHAAGPAKRQRGAPGGSNATGEQGARCLSVRHGHSRAPTRRPLPTQERRHAGTPPPIPLPRLGGARQFPPLQPSLFPSASARRALCLPAGRACAAAILRCLSPALPFGELSPPPCSSAQRPPPALREETGPGGGETHGGGGEAGRDPEGRKDGADAQAGGGLISGAVLRRKSGSRLL